MICRLCLNNIQVEKAVNIFQFSKNNSKIDLSKVISIHFHLMLLPNDSISSHICQSCYAQIKDFHRYWIYVDQKQKALREEFLELKFVEEGSIEETLSEEEENEQAEEEQEETVEQSFEVTSDDVYVDAVEDEIMIDTSVSQDSKKDTLLEVDHVDVSKLPVLEDGSTLSITFIDHSSNQGSESVVSEEHNPLNDTLEDTQESSEEKTEPQSKTEKTSKSQARYPRISGLEKDKEIVSKYLTLSCDLCQYPVDDYNDLQRHFRTMHKRTAYVKCCNTNFRTLQRLVEHVKWHLETSNFKCKVCMKEYRNIKCLKKHEQDHLENENNTCKLCNKSFPRLYNLRRHIDMIHQNKIPFVCDVCGQKFRSKQTFDKHSMEHKGIFEPPVQCKECGEWLKNKNRLRVHRHKHLDLVLECNVCGRQCPTRKALQGHMRYMHKREKNLDCKYCNKSFKLQSTLQEHLAMHTGAKLYACPHCPKQNRSKANMYVHIKRFHVDEWIKSKKAKSYDPSFKKDKSADETGSIELIQ